MIEDGVYFIYADLYTNLVLDVPGGRTEDQVIIQQFGWHGGTNQQWRLTNVGNDFFTIVNVHTSKALDVPYGSPIRGVPIQQYSLHGQQNQQWRFQTFPAVTGPTLFRPEYHRIYNRQSELAMDVPYGSLAWQIKIHQWTPHNGWNQTWRLEKL